MKQNPTKIIPLIIFAQFILVVLTLYYGLLGDTSDLGGNISKSQVLISNLEKQIQKYQKEFDDIKKIQTFMEEDQPYSLFSTLSIDTSSRIDISQNPPTCSFENSLFCKIPDHCGFGCQAHALLHCLGHAVATNKTAIITGDWTYTKCGWNCYFKPFSKCQDFDFQEERILYSGTTETGIITELPPEIYQKLKPYHHDPVLWYIGQLVKYMLRPQDTILEKINMKKAEIKWDHPIVGIHVRRTDKVTGHAEAAFHPLEEYMDRVEAFYLLHYTHLRKDQKRVYIATDDETLLKEAKTKYPQYTFLTSSSAENADLNKRYTDESLLGLIFDIFLLAETDFFIGTFSSQVSRFAYELMQTKHINGMNLGVTLMHDDGYYLGNGGTRTYDGEWLSKFVGIYLPEEEYQLIDERFKKIRTTTIVTTKGRIK